MPAAVSVIMASYNYARYLPAALDSVLAQTWPHWELLVVDDGSKDNSLDVLRRYAARHPRIRVLRHPDGGNHGLPATLRLGLDRARHDLVAFLESDDAWKPRSLEARVALLERTDADVCCCGLDLLEEGVDGERLREFLRFTGAWFSRRPQPFPMTPALHQRCLIPTLSSALLRRRILDGCDFFPPEGAWLDWWLWQQTALNARFAFTPERLVVWRLHPDSYIQADNRETQAARRKIFLAALRRRLRPLAHGRPDWWLTLTFPTPMGFFWRALMRVQVDGWVGLLRVLRTKFRGIKRNDP